MLKWLAVGLGGALGSMARHGVNLLMTRLAGVAAPWATLSVNLVGCGAIGLLAGLVAVERVPMSPDARLFVFAGILGGFTTFSSFGLDTLMLVRDGRAALAIANVAIQVVVGLGAVALGYAIAARA